MFKPLFAYLLVTHILGDFYLQSETLAKRKETAFRYVSLHGLIYLLCSVLCAVPLWSWPLLLVQVCLAASHFLVDSIKFLLTKNKPQNAAVFTLDQIIHLLLIASASSILVYNGVALMLSPAVGALLNKIFSEPQTVFIWTGMLLMAYKPANIMIKRLLDRYKPAEETTGQGKNAGAFIGTLERIIMLALLSVGQYSAIGLVLTAKSVARYNKIAEEKNFAEYYLLGTLLSALYAIVVYFLFLK